jgi:antitoxin MazE
MTTENDALAINAAKSKKRRRYDLERLIEGITEENQHSEIDWGPASGNEAW